MIDTFMNVIVIILVICVCMLVLYLIWGIVDMFIMEYRFKKLKKERDELFNELKRR